MAAVCVPRLDWIVQVPAWQLARSGRRHG